MAGLSKKRKRAGWPLRKKKRPLVASSGGRREHRREDVGAGDDPDQLRAAVDHRDPVHLVLEHQPGRVGDLGRRARGDRRRAHRVPHRRARGTVLADDVLAAEDADEGLGALGGDDGDARDLCVFLRFCAGLKEREREREGGGGG